MIGLTLYHILYGWISELCDVEAAFIHACLEVGMYIEWYEGIVELGIIKINFCKNVVSC